MTEISYTREAGAGPPIVFLHGWTMESSVFAGQFARLQDRFHCLAPDLPGHGRSVDLTANVEAAARLLRSIIESRNLRNVTLVGWSLGATVAWTYLARFGSGRIGRMVSVDMSPKIVNEGDWSLGLKGQNRAQTAVKTAHFAEDWHASAPAIATNMFASRNGAPDLGLERAVEKIRANDPAAMNSMWASLVSADCRPVIPCLGVPLLVAHGALSRVYPAATAKWLAETARQARRHTFEASGHSPHLEEPDEFARTLAAFASI
ncbi:alpha/beta fold hydrolase [Nitratireductor thuwali]|uniref:AB hydrolase superfamily protein YdjP n=1 Tax=Nitratireductor thuwali TaxID=2267699 RepID=A0ABY5MHA6_9HYPH|nr:AB hydrolase superfamily protein YdjP [Nitratireductor thuwali]